MIKVREIMTENVISLFADDKLSKASDLMYEKKIRHIPIVDESQNLIGLVTQHDVLKAATSCLEVNSTKINIPGIPIAKIMTQRVRVVSPNERLKTAGIIMEKYKHGCIPVVKNEKLVGIITDTDFVGVAINLIEQMDFQEEFDQEAEDY